MNKTSIDNEFVECTITITDYMSELIGLFKEKRGWKIESLVLDSINSWFEDFGNAN